MKLVLMASGDFAIPTLRSIANRGQHEIAFVITQPDRPAGRGRESRPTPVRTWAEELGLQVFPVADVNDAEVVARLRTAQARLGLVIAFGQKLSPDVLGSFPSGCINLHASLLPKYRGAAPYQWAVINGEERSGVTVFRINDRMDAGPILSSRWTIIRPSETAEELHDRLAQIGPDAVQAALELWTGRDEPAGVPQDESQVSKAPKLGKSHSRIDFSESSTNLAHRICGLWSWPGAHAQFSPKSGAKRERVTLARARPAETLQPVDAKPGTIGADLLVATGGGWLEILEIQPQGGRVMPWRDYVNGRRINAGDRFEPVVGPE